MARCLERKIRLLISLPTQLSYFKGAGKSLRQKLGNVEAKKVLMRAVYLFSIGGNDYFDLYSQNPHATQSYRRQYVGIVIGNLTNVLKEKYSLGGRKIACQNAGPLGCLPAMKARNPQLGSKCAEEPSDLARLHNRALANVLKKLETKVPGFKYSIFDYYSALGDRVNNPSKYAKYAKLPLITPYLHPAYRQYTDEANFASAGAGALVGTYQGSVVDLHAQLRYFKNLIGLLRQKLGDAQATTLLGRAVYLFSIGTNDYIAPYASSRLGLLSHSREEYVDMVIGNLTIVIKEIHKNRGRKFGFQSLPPLGYLPSPRALNLIAVTEELAASVILQNKALSGVLVKLERQLKGFRYSMVN
ncbi:GDSL esterase/lipase 5 [Morella rubra]|uniref:GDSL esterase/lipase 5 n=1 Tax=Morella rubra TaxID=262757 RepID=A0A6A1VZC7_9ROSI|nr:GDSL esterase/lipase 5 [Morella rubra]